MDADQEKKLSKVLGEIAGFHPVLSDLGSKPRTRIADWEKVRASEDLQISGEYWTLVAYADALIRVRLMIEQNFRFVETLGTLAVTRYIFELLVWLRVLNRDRRYGLTYFFQVMEKQIKYYEDYTNRVKKDIALLEKLGKEESDRIQKSTKVFLAQSENEAGAETLSNALTQIHIDIDRKARRHFCIYADQAKTNGYGFQAYLIEKQLLPQLQAQLDELRRKRAEVLPKITERPPVGSKWEKQDQPWRWKEQAESVGMSDQFDFIYSFTSRLLHATPVSLTTNQKLLEPEEMHMFLEYICISIMDIIDLAKQMLADRRRLGGADE